MAVGEGWRRERASTVLSGKEKSLSLLAAEGARWAGRGQIENGLMAVGFLLKAMAATREY